MSEQTEKVIELALIPYGDEHQWVKTKGGKEFLEAIKSYGLIEEDYRVINLLFKQNSFASLGINLNDQKLEIRNAKNPPHNIQLGGVPEGDHNIFDWYPQVSKNDAEDIVIGLKISKIGFKMTFFDPIAATNRIARFAIIGQVVSYEFGLDMAKLASEVLCDRKHFFKVAMRNKHWLLNFERRPLKQK